LHDHVPRSEDRIETHRNDPEEICVIRVNP
jgi:hypothetical protein